MTEKGLPTPTITVAGPQGSGKTTMIKIIEKALIKNGFRRYYIQEVQTKE